MRWKHTSTASVLRTHLTQREAHFLSFDSLYGGLGSTVLDVPLRDWWVGFGPTLHDFLSFSLMIGSTLSAVKKLSTMKPT